MGVSGRSASVGAQPFPPFIAISPPRSSTSSSPQHAGGTRVGNSREGGLRGSASLQDFSRYWDTPSTGVSRSSSIGTLGSPLPLQPSPRHEGIANVRVPKNLLTRGGAGGSNYLSLQVWNAACCSKGGLGLILTVVVLAITLLYFVFLWGRVGVASGQLQYAIVIDCGSTGTRLQFYGWQHVVTAEKKSLPVIVHPVFQIEGQKNDGVPSLEKSKPQKVSRAYKRMETEPGLDKLVHNETGVREAIEPLLDWAAKEIPASAHARTQVFFLATAGLRRLPPADSGWLLDKAWTVLERSSFMCKKEWVRIISGQEEAYYGWIALNYNLKRLGHAPKQVTVGALDLGGSSLEVTFESEDIPRGDYGVNLTVGSEIHNLYAYSHPGFGLNDAFEKTVALLLQRSHPSVESREGVLQLPHPCLQTGYKQPYICSSHCLLPPLTSSVELLIDKPSTVAQGSRAQIELIGKPNWAACQSLAQSVINISGSLDTAEGNVCDLAPCALGKYQPQPHGQYYGLAGFYVVYKFFGLTSSASLDELLLKGQEFCGFQWQEVVDSTVPQPSIDRYCFRAPYVVTLLRKGLHLKDEQVTIGSGDFAWTLGAALKEAGALQPGFPRGPEINSPFARKSSSFPLDLHSFTVLFVVLLVFSALLVACYQKEIHAQLWRHRPYLPLFVPSVGSGPPGWLPMSLRSRLGMNGGSAPGRIGEGRVKLPQSPAPTALNHSFHDQILEPGERQAGGDGPVLECDVLQMPASTAGTGMRHQVQLANIKLQQKGGSRLQSRRTQSREDLSVYMFDNHLSKDMQGLPWMRPIYESKSPLQPCRST